MIGWYIFFLFLALLILLSAVGVVVMRHPVYSALSLLFNLCVTAVMYLALMGAPFIAMIQVIVYAGAIVVFFLFVLMLMNLKRGEYEDKMGPWRIVLGIGAFLIFLLQVIALSGKWKGWVHPGSRGVGIGEISRLLFTRYVLPFELVSLLIFVAAVGAVALAKKRL